MTPWEEFLESYNKKIELEEYQEHRVLPRPKTTKMVVAAYLAGVLILLIGGGVGVFSLPWPIWCSGLLYLLYIVAIAETYGRFLGIKIVECYQHYAQETTRRRCKCIPSCSEYAILCFKKYGLVRSLRKIRKRLYVTCQGFDYIVDNP